MLLLFLDFFLDDLPTCLVLLAFKSCRQGCAQFFYERLHIPAQFHAFSSRQAQSLRFVGLLEVVNIAPIGGNGLAGGPLLKGLAKDGTLSCSPRPQCKNVITLLLDANAELNRFCCPNLSDHTRQSLEIGRRLEGELFGITALI